MVTDERSGSQEPELHRSGACQIVASARSFTLTTERVSQEGKTVSAARSAGCAGSETRRCGTQSLSSSSSGSRSRRAGTKRARPGNVPLGPSACSVRRNATQSRSLGAWSDRSPICGNASPRLRNYFPCSARSGLAHRVERFDRSPPKWPPPPSSSPPTTIPTNSPAGSCCPRARLPRFGRTRRA